ncbi:MAG TPA: hypothetical protein V6C85_09455 [Allocoleopsis sp.]
MTIVEKIRWVVLPSLLVIGIGILEIKFPHALAGFDDGYAGHGAAGLIMLTFELFLILTWGKVEGGLLIIFGILAIMICLFPKKEQALESSVTENNKNSSTSLLSSAAFRTSKAYVQRQLRNKRSGSNS